MRRLGHVTTQRLTLVVYLVFSGLLSVPLSLMTGAIWRTWGHSYQLLRRLSGEKERLTLREPIQIHTEQDSGATTAYWDVAGGH